MTYNKLKFLYPLFLSDKREVEVDNIDPEEYLPGDYGRL